MSDTDVEYLQAQVASLEQLVEQYESTITEQARHLRHTVDELSRSNQELEQFAYVASHDLQAPLRTISSYIQLLQKKYAGENDARTEKYLFYVVDGARRMQSLIHDLLEFSRVHKAEFVMLPVDVNAVVAQVSHNLQPHLDEVGGTIAVESLPVVQGDQRQLVSLFQNLIENAIKYRSERLLRIDIRCHTVDNVAHIAVQDNGMGFDTRFAERIFQVFQRLHEPGKYEGNGIGLAIVRKIMERHHGAVQAESQAGQGSCFTVTIPLWADGLPFGT